MKVEEQLKEWNLPYQLVEHEAISTICEAKTQNLEIDGIGCKCLFLKSKKKEYFLYTVLEDKKVDLKELSNKLEIPRLHFASAEELENILGLIPGSVTPLGILNDIHNEVTLIFDKELQQKKILVCPNRNTATMSILYEDLITFIKHLQHNIIEIEWN